MALKMACMEVLQESELPVLIEDDALWLAQYGLKPDVFDDPDFRKGLEEDARIGAMRATDKDPVYNYGAIVAARYRFYGAIGFSARDINKIQAGKQLPPSTDAFIQSQRVLHTYGLNGRKIVKLHPNVTSYAHETLVVKLDTIASLGLDVTKVVNAAPSVLSRAPDTIRNKMSDITALGLDAARIVNLAPFTLNYSSVSMKEKFDNLTELGFDAVRIFSKQPSVFGVSTEVIQTKLDMLTKLGLDVDRIIYVYPGIFLMAAESIQKKIRLLNQVSSVLKWEGEVHEFVEAYPAILGFSSKKITTFARLAADRVHPSERAIEARKLMNILIPPVEKYLIALSDDEDDRLLQANELRVAATKIDLSKVARIKKAKQVAPGMGKLGAAYLRYQSK